MLVGTNEKRSIEDNVGPIIEIEWEPDSDGRRGGGEVSRRLEGVGRWEELREKTRADAW